MANEVNTNVLAWMQSSIDDQSKAQILKMLKENETELIDSFCKPLEFGTGGMRGKMGVGTNRMNKYTVGIATQGFANYLKKNFKNIRDIKIVIAYDTRNNSKYFAQIAADVMTANDIKVLLFDNVRPTPELSFAIRNLKANAGIVVTASHNPKEYNGYKVYWEDGAQVLDPHDKNIINEVYSLSIDDVKFTGKPEYLQIIGEDFDSLYLAQLVATSLNPEILKNNNLKVVYTPLHGTGYDLLPKLLNNIGFTNLAVVEKQAVPDGNFPTVKSPNPENGEALTMAIEQAKSSGADLVLATDPDADRIGIAVKDSNGEFVLFDGNQTGSILANYVLSTLNEQNKIKLDDYIVKTIVTSDLLKEIADSYNVKSYEVLTGFKYIARVIKENAGAKFIGGFEESYGYLFSDIVRDKDALMSALLIIEAALTAKKQEKTLIDVLNDLYIKHSMYKTKLINIEKDGVAGLAEINEKLENLREDVPAIINDVNVVIIRDYLDGVESNLFNGEQNKIELPKSNVLQLILEDGTKITIRPSGTEPKMKIYFSFKSKVSAGDNLKNLDEKYDELIKQYLKALDIA